MMVARPPVVRRPGCELLRARQVILHAVPRGRACPLPLGAITWLIAPASASSHDKSDATAVFGGLVSDPSQLTEGEPGCMFLLEGVTNPAESPLGLPLDAQPRRDG